MIVAPISFIQSDLLVAADLEMSSTLQNSWDRGQCQRVEILSSFPQLETFCPQRHVTGSVSCCNLSDLHESKVKGAQEPNFEFVLPNTYYSLIIWLIQGWFDNLSFIKIGGSNTWLRTISQIKSLLNARYRILSAKKASLRSRENRGWGSIQLIPFGKGGLPSFLPIFYKRQILLSL